MDNVADLKKAKEDANAFCATHVIELARDLIVWRRTSKAPVGRLQELADICAAWAGTDEKMLAAEDVINRKTCEIVAALGNYTGV
jgi:hypothetical protein